MISEKQFFEAAQLLNVEIAAIRAVAHVESRGAGFMSSGEPVILFEPHVFWEQLEQRKLKPEDYLSMIIPITQNGKEVPTKVANPVYEGVLYKKWKTKPYGSMQDQHGRLQLASKIHREAALSSASWGRFQIMGFNYKACGCASVQEFINAMYKSEDEHLRLFCNFVKSKRLDTPLRAKNWAAFALGYNGKGYKENKYDTRMADAYKIFLNLKLKN